MYLRGAKTQTTLSAYSIPAVYKWSTHVTEKRVCVCACVCLLVLRIPTKVLTSYTTSWYRVHIPGRDSVRMGSRSGSGQTLVQAQ